LPATLYDVARGALFAARLARRENIKILHGRSHVGAAISALARAIAGGKMIFDIRGLLADEYVSAGNWPPGGLRYRLTKAAERRLLRTADALVVLTEKGRAALRVAQPVVVIPCCVDVPKFGAAKRAELGLHDRVVFVHAGTLGGPYLPRETADLLAAARERDHRTFALILTPSAPEVIAVELERRGFTGDDYRVIKAQPDDVPGYLAAADVGLLLLRPSSARDWSSPTKFGEYLAAGLPVIATATIGDLDAQIERGRLGALLHRHDRAAYDAALQDIDALRRDPQLAERCRAFARDAYDLRSVGAARYRRLYDALSRRLRVLALASYPVEGASSRFRIVQFIEPLAARGIDLHFSPFLDASLFEALYRPRKLLARLPRLIARTFARLAVVFRRADAVFVQREAMLFGPPVIEWLTTRLRRRPLILDLDDATWIAYRSPVYGRVATVLKWPRKTDRLIRWARAVICGSPNIAAHVSARGAEALQLQTIVDTRVYRPRQTPPPGIPVIGWIGTHGTFPFVQHLMPLLEQIRSEVPFEMVIIGSGGDADTRAWSMEREPDDFRALDIGVYPLGDDAWSAAKSGFKAVQYMASGVPFVMSPVGVAAAMGVPGETHFLASTEGEWRDALRRLLTDGELRARMGRAGRAFAERHYSIDSHADVLAAAIRKAVP
jgi:glycosyltransferase involved in cell wall biosynthesis